MLLKIIIVNYPAPDRSVRRNQLREGKAIPRRYRNRRIGDFLKELEITEGRSTGMPKILRTMKKNRLTAKGKSLIGNRYPATRPDL
jgi:ATP-dependent DNA helicase RecG